MNYHLVRVRAKILIPQLKTKHLITNITVCPALLYWIYRGDLIRYVADVYGIIYITKFEILVHGKRYTIITQN